MSTRQRLEKLLGMLASDFDGERSNAALLIARMAKDAKLTVVELIQREFGPNNILRRTAPPIYDPTPGFRPPPPPPRNFSWDDASYVLAELRQARVSSILSREERAFIARVLTIYDTDDQMPPHEKERARVIINKVELSKAL